MTQRDLNEEWARTQLEAWADGSLDRREPRAHGRCDRSRSAARCCRRARRCRASCVALVAADGDAARAAAPLARDSGPSAARGASFCAAGVRERRGCRGCRRRRSLAQARAAGAVDQRAVAAAQELEVAMRYLQKSARITQGHVTSAVGTGLRDAVAVTREALARDTTKPEAKTMKIRSALLLQRIARVQQRRECARLFSVRRHSGARCGAVGSRSILDPDLMGFFSEAAKGVGGGDAAALEGITNVRVRVYEDIGDETELLKFVDDTSRTLERDGWRSVVRVNEGGERVRMFMKTATGGANSGRIEGITVMVVDTGGGDEAVFINVAGASSPSSLAGSPPGSGWTACST